MSDLFWHLDRVGQAIDWLMSGDGDLHSRFFRAWNAMGEPFHVEQFPKDLRPVYRELEAAMGKLVAKERDALTAKDSEEMARLAKCVLKFYQYLIEYRFEKDPDDRITAEEIMKDD